MNCTSSSSPLILDFLDTCSPHQSLTVLIQSLNPRKEASEERVSNQERCYIENNYKKASKLNPKMKQETSLRTKTHLGPFLNL